MDNIEILSTSFQILVEEDQNKKGGADYRNTHTLLPLSLHVCTHTHTHSILPHIHTHTLYTLLSLSLHSTLFLSHTCVVHTHSILPHTHTSTHTITHKNILSPLIYSNTLSRATLSHTHTHTHTLKLSQLLLHILKLTHTHT